MLMNLMNLWEEHLEIHKDAQIECEICLSGNYLEPHPCVFINVNASTGNCSDIFASSLVGSIDRIELISTAVSLSARDELSDDAHFYYFSSLVAKEKDFELAYNIRISTTNRYSPLVPSPEDIECFGIVPKSTFLYRGMRINQETFDQFLSQKVGDKFMKQSPILSTTSLLGRAHDYSFRRRPLDAEEVNSGILLEIKGATGFPLASLSTYPKEREWRVGGEFLVSQIQKDIDPGDYYRAHADWVLENWTKPVHTMSNWALISLESIK